MTNTKEDKLTFKQNKISPSQTTALKIIHILKSKQEIDYFFTGPGTEANRVASAETTLNMHDNFSDIFPWIGCFKGTFTIQVKDDVKPYQVLPSHVANALQQSL